MKPLTNYDLNGNKIEDFAKILITMPKDFTSSKFKNACNKNGLKIKEHGGITARILKTYGCKQLKPGSRTFSKTTGDLFNNDEKHYTTRQEISKIHDEAFKAMNNQFTSYVYAEYIRIKYSNINIPLSTIKYQLEKRGAYNNGKNGKTWTKPQSQNIAKVEIGNILNISSIDEAIKLLKANGYKVYRPKSTWEEI